MLSVGIVGLPNSGKSTLFNALVRSGATVAPYPFTTVEPNVGVVSIPDERLSKVAGLAGCERKVPADVRFIDIAGLVEGANKGEGLGNRFLAKIREVDAILHVVRAFESKTVAHVAGTVDPVRDAQLIETELRLSDLEVFDKALTKARREAKSGNKEAMERVEALEKLENILAEEEGFGLEEARKSHSEFAKDLGLLCLKPAILVLNVGEERNSKHEEEIQKWAHLRGIPFVIVNAEIEEEIGELPEEEELEYRSLLEMGQGSLGQILKMSYETLGLITFFSIDSGECKAWSIPAGSPAGVAAGRIHTDFERGFVKAEVVHYNDFLECGSFATAKEKGILLVEGRDYTVQDGDVIHFKFAL
ncbi:MAG: redox-regulated ATPase YchF [Actinomycetota bacterium]|nr:redox-regulated ATPase YchF [Actinomycetota bacterium]